MTIDLDQNDENEDEAQNLLDIVYNYAKTHDEFDTDFVDSLQNQFDDRGHLTETQLTALRNIIAKWRME